MSLSKTIYCIKKRSERLALFHLRFFLASPHMRPTKQAPWENPKRPWNGPCVFQASSTACKLSWNPNAGPLLLVPLKVPSSLLAHQLRCSSTGCSPGFRGAATWGADMNTKSAYFPVNFRNEPNLLLNESAVILIVFSNICLEKRLV